MSIFKTFLIICFLFSSFLNNLTYSETSETKWVVDENGYGDFTNIYEAVNFVVPGDTILLNKGTYEITIGASTKKPNIVLQISPGTVLSFVSGSESIYLGPKGIILGVENITLDPQILLYNTPEPREPLPEDNLIGLFATIDKALEISSPGKTVCVGPGDFSALGSFNQEGLIGTLDPSDPNNPNKNTIIHYGFALPQNTEQVFMRKPALVFPSG